MVKRAALLVAVAACTDNTVVIVPIVDVPTNETALAFPLDSITISVAHGGADVEIASATVSRGDTIEVPGVPFGDDLVVHMTGRVGTSEVAYGRTCQFSVRPDGRLPSPHLFFSRQVKFASMATRPLTRVGGIALQYPDGSGLLLGGYVPGEPPEAITQVERFDPNTGEYEVLHDIQRRLDSAVALLGTGADVRVVVIGGVDAANGAGAMFVEVIEADRTTERQYEMFFEPQMARVGLSATTLVDGRVVVVGGRTPGGASSRDVAEVSITAGIPNVRLLRAQLVTARYGHTATRLADDVGAAVLIAGGLDDLGMPVARAELFKPLSEGFSGQFTAQMIVPRSRHQAVRMPDGSVLFIGGVDATGVPISKLELFSLDSGFVDVGELPTSAGRVDLTATVLPDGRVLLTGGKLAADGGPVNNAFIARLDPLDGTVDIVATDRLSVPRAGHSATLLCDGTVLISGGSPTQEIYERYNPPPLGRR